MRETAFDLHELAARAECRIRGHVRETPLEPSPALSDLAGIDVSLKLENFQETGSFKLRGALSKLTSMTDSERERGVITASTGNHGLATAHAARELGMSAEVVVPETVSAWRADALRGLGAAVSVRGAECAEAEAFARDRAARTGRVYVSPYNDIEVVAGQGTIGLELARQCPRADLVAATVGGGGLLAGVAGALKDGGYDGLALGCVPANSPTMYESVRAGLIITTPVLPTLSGSSAGNVEEGAITFDLCRRYVDDWAVVSEDRILDAVRIVYRHHDMVIEGAAGVAVAGLVEFARAAGLNRESRAVIIVCGGNVSPELLARVVLDKAD
ncbi:MAG: pyridoxal-phosphate dependent enzyme [Candidatus Eisenbacteria bacterium]|nr:pyridoxal-phosphate dependent enzyme [Candidatus Eisenbacteria bacterium]